VGGKKMIYQWNDDLNIVTQQTEESKRAGEILENLKLGCVSSLGVFMPSASSCFKYLISFLISVAR
jgi:hypothetical protein